MAPSRTNRRSSPPATATAASFGERLKFARREQGRTLRDVAEAAGISLTYLSDLERGVLANPTLDVLVRLVKALQVPLEELLGIELPGPKMPAALHEAVTSAAFQEAIEADAVSWRTKSDVLASEWANALNGMRVAGRQPKKASDYLFVMETLRRVLG